MKRKIEMMSRNQSWRKICQPIVAVGTVLSLSLASAQIATASTERQEVTLDATHTPAILGGNLHGTTTQTEFVDGFGKLTATIDNDTGKVTIVKPDGSVVTKNLTELAKALQDRINGATPQQVAMLKAHARERISKRDVCPYVVGLFGTAHGMAWSAVLSMAAVNPAIAALALLGESAFWIWVSTHC